MMRPPEKRNPAHGGRPGFGAQTNLASGLQLHSTLQQAALLALDTELAIIVAALHEQASGRQLSWEDQERCHQAHQFFIRILADLRGVEVLT